MASDPLSLGERSSLHPLLRYQASDLSESSAAHQLASRHCSFLKHGDLHAWCVGSRRRCCGRLARGHTLQPSHQSLSPLQSLLRLLSVWRRRYGSALRRSDGSVRMPR
ncbi:hypothetical protein KC325_g93 [Hortaea werneckii]|nr:hypothetical protein KC325_g93 [Hortaea werneckii]